MPKAPHETLHRIFRHQKSLFVRALKRDAGIDFPEVLDVKEVDTNCTETQNPLEGEVDTILLAETVEGRHIVIIEAQGRIDPDKEDSWPYYIAYMRRKHRCPVTLIVVCHDDKTADWARTPIPTGLRKRPSQWTHTIGLGPGDIAPLTSADEIVEDPLTAAFSILAHALTVPRQGILEMLQEGFVALKEKDEETARFVAKFVHSGLSKSELFEPMREIVSAVSRNARLFDEIRAEGRAEGVAEGVLKEQRRMLLNLLAYRRLCVSDRLRTRILACEDSEAMDLWLKRASNATSIDEVFSDD